MNGYDTKTMAKELAAIEADVERMGKEVRCRLVAIRLVALVIVVAALVFAIFAAAASAHEYDSNGNTVYSGTECGGNYISPFTGSAWKDCFLEEGYQYESACDGTCTAILVYRKYNHYRDDWQLSYQSWRLVDIRWA